MHRDRTGDTVAVVAWPIAALLLTATLAIASRATAAGAIAVTTAARAIQPGELVVFTIGAPAGAMTVSVAAFDRETPAIPKDGTTWVALVGIDLDVRPGTTDALVTVRTPAGLLTATHRLTVQPKQFPTRRLKVNPALVEPPVSALQRITREVARTNEIFASPADVVLWHGPFVRPVESPANSRFGARSVYNGRPGSPHSGADFLSPSGTSIRAPNSGRIRLAEDLYFSGNTVIVDHGLGLFSLFAHLSAFEVQEGDTVSTGDVLGLVGATGRVTGPHLHWTVRATGARVDPLSLLAVLGGETTTVEADRDQRAPVAR